MSSADAKRLVILSLVVSGALVAAHEFKAGKVPSVRLGIGAVFAGVFLSALAEPAPQVAGPLAALLLSGTLFTVGPDVLGAVAKTEKGSQ